jgi:hypothetical protein
MSKTYQYIVDVIARTKSFTQGMQDAVKQMKTAEKAAADMNKMTSGIGNSLKGIGAAAGIAFGANEVLQFGKEIVNLSGEVAGVERAFKTIGNADYLRSLRASTHNTVSDLELMKRAVSANNFGIPLQSLGSLFEFAAARAQATGQSVDYLVDSIVTGIGRKSPLILDNLGISAVALKEKMGGVGTETASIGQIAEAVGKIASEQLGKMGGYAETSATQISQVSAQWANFKAQLSQSESVISSISSGTKLMSSALTQLDGMLSAVKNTESNWYDGFLGPIKGAQYVINMFRGSKEAVAAANKEAAKSGEDLTKKLAEQKQKDAQGTESILANIEKAKEVFSKVDEKYGKYEKGTKEKTESIRTAYEKLSESITALQKQQQDLALANKDISGITTQITALEKQKEAIDELIRASGVAAQFGKQADGSAFGSVAGDKGKPGMALAKTEDKKLGLIIDPAAVTETKSAYQNALDEIARAEEDFLAKHQAIQGALEGGFMAIGQSIVNSLGFAKDGLGGFVSVMFETATQLIAMALSQSIATSIAGATLSGSATGPAAIFTTPAFIATAIGGVLAAFAAIPKFAQGGIAYGPTLGMFGEYPGASSNPEVVAPLSKLRDMMQPGGGTTVIMPAGVEIDGYKLRVLLKRVDKSLNARG